MWIIILSLALGSAVAGLVYLFTRFQKFGVVRKLSGGRKAVRRLLACVPLLAIAAYGFFDMVNAVIIVLHLAVFWLIFDLAALIVRAIRGRKKESPPEGEKAHFTVYTVGVCAIAACVVYLAFGWYLAHHVWKTEYRVTTDKEVGNLRVAMIADSHLGTLFDSAKFEEYLREIEALEPDLLVVVGDFVDDSTSRGEMVLGCKALGEFQSKYGVFFVYGNHDKGYYNSRGYTAAELDAELRKNGVRVLEDETVLVDDRFYIIGRKDRNAKERKPIADIVAELDTSKYMIDLNHQPNDYEAEAAAGIDLVLSGHTHGGQLIPLGPIGRLMGANDRTYGREQRGNTTFLVTSGIGDWAIDYKTGTKSEYVIIEIEGR